MTVTKDLKIRYEEEVKEALKSQFGYENVHQIPKLNKSLSTWVLVKLATTQNWQKQS